MRFINSIPVLVCWAICLSLPMLMEAQTGNVTTYAGSGAAGAQDGPVNSATFDRPSDIAIDASGNVYVTDRFNSRIRKIDLTGNVTTFAGTTLGYADGNGTNARFNRPGGLVFDAAGNLYVCDGNNHRIRKIDPNANVSTFAGTGVAGLVDGPANSAQLNRPNGITIDQSGNLYVTESGSHTVRKIDPNGNVSTLAGNGTSGFMDGQGTMTQFSDPSSLAIDQSGNLFVADRLNNRIRKVDPNGNVTTFAGTGTGGNQDGPLASATFNSPRGLSIDANGTMIISENHRIRVIDTTGTVSTLAGNNQGFQDGLGSIAQFSNPNGIAISGSGNIVVADFFNNRIRVVDADFTPIPVPTLGQWGLIILTLLILCIGAVAIMKRANRAQLTGKA